MFGFDDFASAAAAASNFGKGAVGLGSLISSVGGLFGGEEDDGPNQEELLQMQLAKQYEWTAHSARSLPAEQVKGLRAAGLNPMLAVGKGISSPEYAKASLGADDRQIRIQRDQLSLQRSSALAQLALQQSQIELTRAQTEKTKAEALTELKRPENIEMDTKGKLSAAMQAEAFATKAKNEGLLVAAQEVQQSLINEINKTGWLASAKKEELLQLIDKTRISHADARRAETDEQFYKSKVGEIVRTVQLILGGLRR